MTKSNLKVLVTRIIMEGDKAVGVELKQGKKVELMRKAIVLNLMLMIGPKILILYTTWRHWVTLMATLQSMNSNRLQRSKKDVFILSLSSPFDLKYVELWHDRVLLLYNTNHLTIFYAEVGKKFLLNIALKIFQLRSVLSNLNEKFLTSDFLTKNFPTAHFFDFSFPTTCIPS